MRIPIIEATEPLTVISPEGAGRGWRAIGAAAGEVQNLSDTLVQIDQGKRKVQDALDLQTGIDDYRTKMADYILKLDNEPDKTNYAEKVNAGSLEIQKSIYGKMKSPNVQNALKSKFSDLGTDYYIKGKIYENNWFMSSKTAEAKERLYNLGKRAGEAATELEMEKLRAEGQRLIDTLTGTIYNPEQASKEKIALNELIEKETLKNKIAMADMEIFQTPHKADEILQKDRYRDIPEDKKVSLLNKGIIRADKIDKKTKEDTEKVQEEITYDMSVKILKGNYTLDEIINLGDKRDVDRKQFEHLETMHRQHQERLAKTKDESDSAEYKRISLDVHSSNPKTTEREIQTNSKLSTKDQLSLLDRLRTQKDHIRTKGDQENFRSHQQAEQIGFKGLTTRSPFEALDPVSQELQTLFLEELTRRSSAFRGNEDPISVKEEILPKYQKILLDRQRMSTENYKKLLRFGSAIELEQAYKSKMISAGEYESQKRIFTQYYQAMKDAEMIEQQIKEKSKAKR